MDMSKARNYNNNKARRNEEEEEEEEEEISSNNNDIELRRGPWTVEEDLKLINYIAIHGEGRWNSLSRAAGLKRTGKSCRLRWLNYLRPDVRRGNITLEEQLIILELHSRWGNRWSKIAQYLPGRTDNEIKNYWRTRVQKHAKQLKCDVNSKQFKDTMKYLWMPRLVERIQATAATAATAVTAAAAAAAAAASGASSNDPGSLLAAMPASYGGNVKFPPSYTPENSSIAATSSSESLGTQVSPANSDAKPENYREEMVMSASPASFFNGNHQVEYRPLDQPYGSWFDGGDATGGLWNFDDFNWFLQQQQLNSNNCFM